MHNFKNTKILITGHTGLKGSWLSLWLSHLGANVYGISNNLVAQVHDSLITGRESKFEMDITDKETADLFKEMFYEYENRICDIFYDMM